MKGFELFSDIEYVKKDSKDPKKVLWRSLIIGTIAFVFAMGSYSVLHSALRYKMSSILPELLGVSVVAAAVWSVFFMSRHVEEQSQQEKAEYTDTRTQVRFKEMSHEERAELVKKNPLYGRVICRCETITEGEIVDAIHRPIPVKTVDGIKRRCGAGLGRCQGGFCGPRVVEILARELSCSRAQIDKDKTGSYIVRERED